MDLPDEPRAPEEFVVLRENWDAVRTFLAAAGQWRAALKGELLGLDYGAVRAAALGLGVKWREVFPAVALMEGEVLRLRGAKA